MRGALLHTIGADKLDIRDDLTLVPVGPTDVRVRIRATGVCHSDLSAISGVLPQPALWSPATRERARSSRWVTTCGASPPATT